MNGQSSLIARAFERAANDAIKDSRLLGLFWMSDPEHDNQPTTYRLVVSADGKFAHIDRLKKEEWPHQWSTLQEKDSIRLWMRMLESQFEGGSRKNCEPDYSALEAMDNALRVGSAAPRRA